jgi:hypothetical protein
MAERMIAISDFANSFQAETIRIRLATEGIQAFLTGTDAAAALAMGGAGSDRLVRLEVAHSDHQRAVALLKADRERMKHARPWICSRCHEQNEPAFEVCWNCDKPLSDE